MQPIEYFSKSGGAFDRRTLIEIATIALIVTGLTTIACRVFPLWDDGVVWLQVQHAGGQAVYETMVDRPVTGKIFQVLADSGNLREWTALIHWVTWFGMGWITLRIWKVLFPENPRFAIAAALLAVAPVLCRIQTVLLNATIGAVVGPVLVFMAVLPFLSPAASRRTSGQTVLLWAAMVGLISGAVLVSEYALPTVAASVALLLGVAPSDQRHPRRARVTIGLLLIAAVISYGVYHQLADPAARITVRPEAQDWSYRAKWIVPRMLTDVWRLTLGTFMERLGAIEIWNTKEAVAGVFAGLAAAISLTWFVRRESDQQPTDSRGDIGDMRILVTLVGAVTVGFLPVIAMGRGGHSWSSSRFWAPILPLTACCAVYLPLVLLRRKTWWLAVSACGFVAGFSLVQDGLLAIHERDRFVDLGDQLESYVQSSGLTVAVVHCTWRYPLPYPKEWELTARLTANWPRAKREHFWAFAGMDEVSEETVERDGKTVTLLDDPFGPHPQLLRDWRSLTRVLVDRSDSQGRRAGTRDGALSNSRRQPEDITQLLWVTESPAGRIHVERLPSRDAESPTKTEDNALGWPKPVID